MFFFNCESAEAVFFKPITEKAFKNEFLDALGLELYRE